MFLEPISTYLLSLIFLFCNLIYWRCVPQNCTFGEKFNAFYGRCERILCRLGFNVTSTGKCIGKRISTLFFEILISILFLDINECAEKPSPCKIGERCDNTPGSYRCVQTFTCSNGLEMKDLQCLGNFNRLFFYFVLLYWHRYWWMCSW